ATVNVTAGTSLIKASDFTTVRTKIGSLWSGSQLGSLPSWSSGVTPSGPPSPTPIYGSDLADLRQWLNAYQVAKGHSQTTWTYNAGQVIVVNKVYDARSSL